MPETTINTFLMYKKDSATEYTKLCDIKDYPDLFGEPDALESTTLSSQAKEYLEGLAGTDKFPFTANYDKTVFDTLIDLKGKEQSLAVWFGATVANGVPTPTGTDGKFAFKGYVSPSIVGKGTNEVREMKVNVTVSQAVQEVSA